MAAAARGPTDWCRRECAVLTEVCNRSLHACAARCRRFSIRIRVTWHNHLGLIVWAPAGDFSDLRRPATAAGGEARGRVWGGGVAATRPRGRETAGRGAPRRTLMCRAPDTSLKERPQCGHVICEPAPQQHEFRWSQPHKFRRPRQQLPQGAKWAAHRRRGRPGGGRRRQRREVAAFGERLRHPPPRRALQPL